VVRRTAVVRKHKLLAALKHGAFATRREDAEQGQETKKFHRVHASPQYA